MFPSGDLPSSTSVHEPAFAPLPKAGTTCVSSFPMMPHDTKGVLKRLLNERRETPAEVGDLSFDKYESRRSDGLPPLRMRLGDPIWLSPSYPSFTHSLTKYFLPTSLGTRAVAVPNEKSEKSQLL